MMRASFNPIYRKIAWWLLSSLPLLGMLTSAPLLAATPIANSLATNSLATNSLATNSTHQKSANTVASPPLYFANIDSVQAQYNVVLDGFKIGTMNEIFTRTKDTYHIENISSTKGLLALFKPEEIRTISTGVVTAHGLRPTTFIQTRKLEPKRGVRADFNWAAHTITLTDQAGSRTAPLPAGTQDRLSIMYQFLHLSLKDATTLNLSMTNGSKITDYLYHITPNQRVTTPLGTFKATYLSSPPQENAKRTEIWLASKHENFPCKMIVTDAEGQKFTQVLTKLKITPP